MTGSAVLHPDLARYVTTRPDGEPFVAHPLVQGFLTPPEAMETMNECYTAKLEACAKAEADGDWGTYVSLYEHPYRLEAVQDVCCSGNAYMRLVREVWTDSENIWQFEEEWRDPLPSGAGWDKGLMNTDERGAFAALPDPVPVFRGYSHDDGELGLSWTTDRERAEWFARRFAALTGPPRLAVGTIPKSKVIAYLLERQESEVIALPEHVSIASIEPAR